MATICNFRVVWIITMLLFYEALSKFIENEEKEDERPTFKTEVHALESWSSRFPGVSEDLEVPSLQRSKRKVLSRAGLYIIRSKIGEGGISPWGSSSSNLNLYTSGNNNKRSPYLGGWNVKGNLDKLPNGRLDIEGTTPYSSQTVRRINTLELQKRERKKISKSLKAEIARFALRNGAEKASIKYEFDVGRRLRQRVIEKFARRYSKRLSKKMRQ